MKTRAALLMVLPAVLLFGIEFLWPAALVVRMSFFKTDVQKDVFIGVLNYVTAVQDPYFIKSFLNSFILVLLIAPMMTVVSYWMASMLSDFSKKVQGAVRFIIYVPGLVSGIIMGLLWGWVLQRAGLLNGVLSTLGIAAVPWLDAVWPARFSIAVISLFSGVGGYVIMFAMTMHSIPDEMKDAAKVDGASGRQYKRYIQRPMMMPMVLLSALLSLVGVMQMWETIYMLTAKGGPEGSTASPVYEIFMTAFIFGKQGLAAAKGIILMLVIAAILLTKQRIEKLFK